MPRVHDLFIGFIACFAMASPFANVTSEAAKLLLNAEKNLATKEAGLITKLLKPASAELSLVERYGEKVRNKVGKDSLKCVGNRLRESQIQPSQKKLSAIEKEKQAQDQCFGGFLKCMDISYKNIKDPTAKMFDRCIAEVNTKFEKYANKK
jgi:hypothetical protein